MTKMNVILGAGCAGLGAAYKLKNEHKPACVIEKDATYGGLSGHFVIDGFRFDKFVHFSFATEPVRSLFDHSAGRVISHTPNPFNIYKGLWIKHPAQNNLYPLPEEEKKKIVDDFLKRPAINESNKPENYEQWLRLQFGDYFADHFPMVYTRKYWMREARNLRTEWVGNRVYQPSVEEVIQGCKTSETPVTYYAKEMRYPAKGGFSAYLKDFTLGQDIRYKCKVLSIDSVAKTISVLDNGVKGSLAYERLISSLPLPEVVKMLPNVPQDVVEAANNLHVTSGYQISVGLKTKNIPPYLWWYIYDEDILPARVYSPSLKSPDNAPEGCSSLQFEIYCTENEYSKEELIRRSVDKVVDLGIIKRDDILFRDVRFEKYANIIFDEGIYKNRKIVRDYLDFIGIETIGRFGEWDYLWTHQSVMSGMNVK
jgi:protoporphyrinogen oxidase